MKKIRAIKTIKAAKNTLFMLLTLTINTHSAINSTSNSAISISSTINSINTIDKKPRVSIITSLYKGRDYIAPFLRNITRQTIFNECELIIINANSPDKESKIIRKFMEIYPNIKYIELKEDPGLYGVWNMAIDMARAPYITNANVDDRLHPECYEQHARALDQSPDWFMVHSDYYYTPLGNESFKLHTGILMAKEAQNRCSLPGPNPMWRKSVHNILGHFDETYKICGDWDFWCKAMEAHLPIGTTPGAYVLFYSHPEALSFPGENHTREYDRLRAAHPNIFKKNRTDIKQLLSMQMEDQ
jgi:glycosyltransferase involved in cell wall biosynthesis